MGSFNFKSVGKTREQQVIETLTVSDTPMGIRTPLSLGYDNIFNVTYNLEDQVGDNLRNLLMIFV